MGVFRSMRDLGRGGPSKGSGGERRRGEDERKPRPLLVLLFVLILSYQRNSAPCDTGISFGRSRAVQPSQPMIATRAGGGRPGRAAPLGPPTERKSPPTAMPRRPCLLLGRGRREGGLGGGFCVAFGKGRGPSSTERGSCHRAARLRRDWPRLLRASNPRVCCYRLAI